jgi:hypothetical protein
MSSHAVTLLLGAVVQVPDVGGTLGAGVVGAGIGATDGAKTGTAEGAGTGVSEGAGIVGLGDGATVVGAADTVGVAVVGLAVGDTASSVVHLKRSSSLMMLPQQLDELKLSRFGSTYVMSEPETPNLHAQKQRR